MKTKNQMSGLAILRSWRHSLIRLVLPGASRRQAIFFGGLALWLFVGGGVSRAAETIAAPGEVVEPQPILAELQQKMAAVQSVYLEFTQERQLQLFAAPLRSEGVMLLDAPGQIRWETVTPFQSMLLGNQKSVAQFEYSGGQWTKLKLGFPQLLKRVMDQMTLMHQGRLDGMTNEYSLVVRTGAVTVITLTPKEAQLRGLLAALEIHLAADLSAPREVILREPGPDFTRIIFQRERRNVKFPARTFDQAKPLDLSAVRAAVAAD